MRKAVGHLAANQSGRRWYKLAVRAETPLYRLVGVSYPEIINKLNYRTSTPSSRFRRTSALRRKPIQQRRQHIVRQVI
jgi:hypothetical protein